MKAAQIPIRKLLIAALALLMSACAPATVDVQATRETEPAQEVVETQEVIPPSTTTHPEPGQPAEEPARIPLIWDDDGSPDGIIALLYFLVHPEVEVLAATVSYGEAHPEWFIGYVADMLDYLGYAAIPLAAGRDSPLEGDNAFPGFLRNPTDSFWDIPLPDSDYALSPLSAPELIVETIHASAEPVTVFVSGSFTNVAEAIRLDPTIVGNIAAIECMGGAIYDPGNVGGVWDFGIDNPYAEWNIYVDPLAANEVWATGVEIHLTPLDATNQVWTTRQDQAGLYALADPTSVLVADLLDWKFAFQGSDSFTIFDLLAAVLTTNPEACAWTDLTLNVAVAAGREQGRTFIDPETSFVTKVCLAPDEGAVRAIVLDVFAGGE